ncbi:class IV lanthionine synthetase LanL [Micromonospora sp. NPDC003197]
MDSMHATRSRAGSARLLVNCVRSVLAGGDPARWSVEESDDWCHVRPVDQRLPAQGWKLHVSATPLSAPLVLDRVARVLVRRQCQFKFAPTIERVRELGSREVDRGSGGKFLTVYPELLENELVALADELHQATLGLPGPAILSDRRYRPGSLVHYRYGVYGGVRMLGNDGSYEAMLVTPDGSIVPDQRKAWFTPPTWAPRDPFTDSPAAPTRAAAPTSVLLDKRYVVDEVIRHGFPGSVYRATDKTTDQAVVIKQARPYASADECGLDIRDRRRHEARMLHQFGSTGFTPQLIGFFEQQGDLFLVQEALPGSTLRQWVVTNLVAEADNGPWGLPLPAALRVARWLVEIVQQVHDQDFVLRDLSPNNIMVTDDRLCLIDLETLAPVDQPAGVAFTPGYGAPEQLDAPLIITASKSADLFGLGAVLFYLVSGVDPVLTRDQPQVRSRQERINNWLSLLSVGNPAARHLAPLIEALMCDDPAGRPSLDAVAAFLADSPDPSPARVRTEPADHPLRFDDDNLRRVIRDATDHLVATMDRSGSGRLWTPGSTGMRTDPINVQHGASGVLAVLVRAYQAEPNPDLRRAITDAAQWISQRVVREPRLLPGLHYGRSGTAWALLEAGRAIDDDRLTNRAIDLAQRVPLHCPNPDVCHGMAGAGLTQLRFWEATGQALFLDRARQVAADVAAMVEHRDGLTLWPIPQDFPSALAGLVHYGFAHGVAGVAAFLLTIGRITGETRYLELAESAAETLRSVALVEDGDARWTSSVKGGPRLTHWCSGASGIGTFLLGQWQHDRDSRWADLLDQAARAVRRARWQAGTGQCHGLAGDGEFLLDLAEASGDKRYRSWAEELASNIYTPGVLRDRRLLVPDESRTTVVADFATGLAGVLAFLLRLRDGGPRMWLPESFTRIGSDPTN